MVATAAEKAKVVVLAGREVAKAKYFNPKEDILSKFLATPVGKLNSDNLSKSPTPNGSKPFVLPWTLFTKGGSMSPLTQNNVNSESQDSVLV